MNIPENILQQVADEAFLSSNGGMMGLLTCNKEKNHVFWHEERCERRAVIQHAISNPALAPFLAGGIGEYTDSDIHCAWRKAVESDDKFVDRIRAFLAALPRRESPVLAEALARAEKAEAELAAIKSSLPAAQVPLGPEDCPPGSTLRAAQGHWFIVLHVVATGVTISNVNGSRFIKWHELNDEGWQINISRPDTGRWDANAWRPCSKPGK